MNAQWLCVSEQVGTLIVGGLALFVVSAFVLFVVGLSLLVCFTIPDLIRSDNKP